MERGAVTDYNTVTVTLPGKGVYIGKRQIRVTTTIPMGIDHHGS